MPLFEFSLPRRAPVETGPFVKVLITGNLFYGVSLIYHSGHSYSLKYLKATGQLITDIKLVVHMNAETAELGEKTMNQVNLTSSMTMGR